MRERVLVIMDRCCEAYSWVRALIENILQECVCEGVWEGDSQTVLHADQGSLNQYQLLIIVQPDSSSDTADNLEAFMQWRKRCSFAPPALAILPETQIALGLRFIKSGGTDFLRMPFGKDELQARVLRAFKQTELLGLLGMEQQLRQRTETFILDLALYLLAGLKDVEMLLEDHEANSSKPKPELSCGGELASLSQGLAAMQALKDVSEKIRSAFGDRAHPWCFVMAELINHLQESMGKKNT